MVNLHQLTPYYTKLYPQNGDHIVTIDSTTSFHAMYTQFTQPRPARHRHDCFSRLVWQREWLLLRTRLASFMSCHAAPLYDNTGLSAVVCHFCTSLHWKTKDIEGVGLTWRIGVKVNHPIHYSAPK